MAPDTDVPPGAYRLRVWHASIPEGVEPTTVPVTIAAADVEQRVVLTQASAR